VSRVQRESRSPLPLSRRFQHLDIMTIRHHDVAMRTTLTLDPDVAQQLERAVRGGGKGLKATVNEALRIGLGMTEKPVRPAPFRIRAFVAGLQPGIDPDKMNQLLDELEAEELARRQRG
jgi:hypothetical protein